jgi:hypothetical protein
MDTKKQDQKPAKTLPLVKLQIVTLTPKDMSCVNGGGGYSWVG